ncbi:MAG TPA: PrsW family glutamic-type intramembrane protease [Ktedonobacterales bacterium]|nr:PrsW family glutamic-type intramembrane protease [Ktedonobacterales bacterium]
MDCSHCGTPVTAGDRVCRVCGAALDAPATVPAQTRMAEGGAPPAGGNSAVQPGAIQNSPAAAPTAPSAGYQVPAGVGLVRNGNAQPAASTVAQRAWPPRADGPVGTGYPAYPGYPGYPAYPAQAAAAPVAPYPYPSQYGYAYPGQYPPQYYMPSTYPAPPPPRAKGETYRLVLAWIVLVGSGLSILAGLLMALVGVVALIGPTRGGLATLDEDIALIIGGIGGGVAGLYFGITAVMKRPSVKFSLPPAWIFLLLTVLVLGTGVVLWNITPTPGPIQAALPLVILSGALPALTILAYAASRLGNPSTWRHTTLSLIHGATLAILLATILEPLLLLLIVLVLNAIGVQVSFLNILNLRPGSAGDALAVLLLLSGVAPLVEEGVKPLAAILLMPRLRGPAEAFLLGLAAGIGFDFVETLGYIGMGNADWISIALQRIGAGLLHGVGAGMAALGWYYLLRGKGVPHRWLLGFGGLLYAVVQHAIFNGSAFLQLIPGPISRLFALPVFLGKLPLDGGTALFFGYYLVILGVLTVVTTRLGRAYRQSQQASPPRDPGASPGTTTAPEPQPVAGGAR